MYQHVYVPSPTCSVLYVLACVCVTMHFEINIIKQLVFLDFKVSMIV